MTSALKTAKCKQCEQEFIKLKALQSVCSLQCAIERGRQRKAEIEAKEQKKKDRKTKERLKTRSQWVKETQQAFNRYIRARDYGKPCISSGRTYQDLVYGGKFEAGHFRSTGAANHLRFNFLNCHGQSSKDNRYLSGNISEYRKGLIDRIGLERVEALESDNTPRKYDIEWLRRAKTLFNKRARYYEKRRGLL